MKLGIILLTVSCSLIGCAFSDSSSNHGEKDAEGPRTLPLLHEASRPDAPPRLAGSGVPRPNGRIISAVHVIRSLPLPPGGACGDLYEVESFRSPHEGVASLMSEDIGWIRTSCDFQPTDRISSDPPPVGTRITISGFPGARYRQASFTGKGAGPKPTTIQAVVVAPPIELEGAGDPVWARVDGVWGHDIPGFSGGPCAYRDDSGDWIVFGVVQSVLHDPRLRVLGLDTGVRAGPRHAYIVIAPIPPSFIEQER